MDNIVYSVWLSEILGVENKTYTKLMDKFDDAYGVYSSEDFDSLQLTDNTINKLKNKDISKALKILDECRNCGIDIIDRSNPLYPKRLLTITTPPYILYVKGKLRDLNDEVCIGVVGTRDMSEVGKIAAANMGYGLAAGGAVVVSGLAQGIDSTAHIGCIKSGGYTVAVLGCGHNKTIRKDNVKLFAKIVETGVVISEFSPSTIAARFTYPQRNRIISGMSQATVVVEANDKSGALITARYAAKQGRSVYAVANNDGVLDYSGGITLLEEGARLIRNADEVLERFELLYPHKIDKLNAIKAINKFTYTETPAAKVNLAPEKVKIEQAKPIRVTEKIIQIKKNQINKEVVKLPPELDDSELGSFEKEVCRQIYNNGSINTDELCIILSSDINKVNMALTMLEISGFIEAAAGGMFLPSTN
ncbi:MAG: DNA protecting protein DprA [Clostridiales bacterium GWF2_38_85]|nr:MAG: DNA protecting protein DprA [Clostridiales bacterium GWF2_38_85]HBL83879.1 DNA-protecting protein DprA [Clostridiales bacterium]